MPLIYINGVEEEDDDDVGDDDEELVVSSNDSEDSQELAMQIEDSTENSMPGRDHLNKRPLSAGADAAPSASAAKKRRRLPVAAGANGDDSDSQLDASAVLGVRLPTGAMLDADEEPIELSDDDDDVAGGSRTESSAPADGLTTPPLPDLPQRPLPKQAASSSSSPGPTEAQPAAASASAQASDAVAPPSSEAASGSGATPQAEQVSCTDGAATK